MALYGFFVSTFCPRGAEHRRPTHGCPLVAFDRPHSPAGPVPSREPMLEPVPEVPGRPSGSAPSSGAESMALKFRPSFLSWSRLSIKTRPSNEGRDHGEDEEREILSRGALGAAGRRPRNMRRITSLLEPPPVLLGHQPGPSCSIKIRNRRRRP